MLAAGPFSRVALIAIVCLALAGGCSVDEQARVEQAASAALTAADCPAGYNVIQGSDGNNTLNGTAGNDCILGNGGADTINGLGGNDFLVGGTGNDKLFGGDGNDTLYGSNGNDTLYGGNNTDSLYGGLGDDRLFGESGTDYLYGNENNDIESGGAGNDECYGGAGNDVIAGGADSDIMLGEDGDDAISDSGTNTVNGGNGSDRCSGTSCELAASPVGGCTQASQCVYSQTCVADVGVCLPCGTVGGVGCNNTDNCPSDPDKTEPGICGCGVPDTDSDSDGAVNCNDGCPTDSSKVTPGQCGCFILEIDEDGDGAMDCVDPCGDDPNKIDPGVCGCGNPDSDADADGVLDCLDQCAGFPDAEDDDDDGVQNGCEPPPPCTIDATGPYVLQGDLWLSGAVLPDDLAFLEGLTCITGSVWIQNTDLTDLSSLASITAVIGDVVIRDNAALTSVDGLDSVETIGGGLQISDNPVLADLAGLSALESLVGDTDWLVLTIDYNAQLPACWVEELEQQTARQCSSYGYTPNEPCIGNLGTGECGGLPPGFVCAPGVTGAGIYDGSVYIDGAAGAEAAAAALAGIQCVTGDVTIADTNLTNLDPLSSLLAVGGNLRIFQNASLIDVDGLRHLVSIGEALNIDDNPALQNLRGLDDLEALGAQSWPSVTITGNAALPACWSWLVASQLGHTCDDYTCSGNTGTGSCGALPDDFECVPGAVGPGVFDGSAEYWNLSSLGGVTCVTGTLAINGTELQDLSMLSTLQLVGGALQISSNPQLTDVDELSRLVSVGEGLYISDNPVLNDLDGLSNLETVSASSPWASLYISANLQLPACWQWLIESQVGVSCDYCAGNIGMSSCGTLPDDFQCVSGATGPGVYDGNIVVGFEPPAEELFGLTCVTGDLLIEGGVASLAPLARLQYIGGALSVLRSDLSSVDGLDSLIAVGGTLEIGGNSVLQDLDGLASLRSIGAIDPSGYLTIADNPELAACWVDAIEAQTSAECGLAYDIADAFPCIENNGAGSCE